MVKSTPETEPELFVFDICDTLFYSNTTFDFIKFVLEARKMEGSLRYFQHYTKRSSPLFIGLAVLQKITKTDWPKKLCLQLLKGISKEELYRLGQAFEKQYLTSRTIMETHKMVEDLKKAGKTIVLISASIDPVVAAIAGALNVGFRSSQLEYDDRQAFTGNLAFEMTGKKLEALEEMLAHQKSGFAVATDNFSDRGLVAAAGKRYVVVYNEKALHYWKDLNPNFIKLYS